MSPSSPRQSRRAQLGAVVLLSVLLMLPFIGPPVHLLVLNVAYVGALVLTVVALGLLLAPAAHHLCGRPAAPPTSSGDDLLRVTGRAALSLATACTAFLLLGHAVVELLSSSLTI